MPLTYQYAIPHALHFLIYSRAYHCIFVIAEWKCLWGEGRRVFRARGGERVKRKRKGVVLLSVPTPFQA